MARRRKIPTARYREGFLARYLRPLIFEQTVVRGWHQYDVARWLGLTTEALSEYLNRRAHPCIDELDRFTKLGCEPGRLRRAIVADKLLLWMTQLHLDTADIERALQRLDSVDARLEIARHRPSDDQRPPPNAPIL